MFTISSYVDKRMDIANNIVAAAWNLEMKNWHSTDKMST